MPALALVKGKASQHIESIGIQALLASHIKNEQRENSEASL